MQQTKTIKNLFLSILITYFYLFNYDAIQAQTVTYQTLYTDATFSKTINNSLPIGVVNGQQSTSPSGSGVYTFPINVTPGILGMEPNLSITYNSQSGSGLLGMGWGLDGLSAITLDNKNLYYDGETEPISVTSQQATNSLTLINKYNPFLLDGQRLIATNGSYGAANTIYGKESEDFSKIISYGSSATCTQCPTSFLVTSKEGMVSEYGNANNARVLATDNTYPIMWRINKLSDPNGNYIDESNPLVQHLKIRLVLTQNSSYYNYNVGTGPLYKWDGNSREMKLWKQ